MLNLVIMSVAGPAVGWRAHRGWDHTLEAFLLLLMLGYAVSWISVWVGPVVRNEETANQIVPLLLPITMLSDAFVPTHGMPPWLRTIADWNPVSAVTAAARQLFGNPGAPTNGAAWPITHPILATVLWPVGLVAVLGPLSVRVFTHEGR